MEKEGLFQRRKNEIIEKVKATEITAENLPELVIQFMKACESYKDMTGPEKKELVTQACVILIDVSDICGPFEAVVLNIVPHLCDMFISVEKGKLTIRSPTYLSKIFKCCK